MSNEIIKIRDDKHFQEIIDQVRKTGIQVNVDMEYLDSQDKAPDINMEGIVDDFDPTTEEVILRLRTEQDDM